MATLYQPKFKLTINGFDVTTSVLPYLISINLQDFFDNNFTVSKLELIFSAKYTRSSSWKYKDQLKLELWYETDPSSKYISSIFYIDYVENIKNETQTFLVSAQEADPSMGFDAGVGITYLNSFTTNVIDGIVFLFGLTTDNDLTPNVYIGNFQQPDTGTVPPAHTSVTITFDNYIAALKHICQKYGYFGNISGTRLLMYRLNSTDNDNNRFRVLSMQWVFDVNYKQSYTQLAKEYKYYYIDRPPHPDAFVTGTYLPTVSSDLDNFIKYVDKDIYYNNAESGLERVTGQVLSDYVDGFQIRITCMGAIDYKAGGIFLLDASYGNHKGYYRCTKISHTIANGIWQSEITGFPLLISNQTSALFDLGYYKSSNTVTLALTVSTNLRGSPPITITGTILDNFAKLLSPNYSSNIGATVVTECTKAANNIRPDILFGLFLWQNNMFRDTNLITKRNPGKLGTVANVNNPETYADWQTGIRASVQIAFAFATTSGSPADAIVATRYGLITRGSATNIAALNGLWDGSNTDFSFMLKSYLWELYLFINNDYSITFT